MELVAAPDVPDYVVQTVIFGPDYETLPAVDYRGAFEERKSVQEPGVRRSPLGGEGRAGRKPLAPEEAEELRRMAGLARSTTSRRRRLREAYDEPEAELVDFVEVGLGKRRFRPKADRVREAYEAWCRQKGLKRGGAGGAGRAGAIRYVADEGWRRPTGPFVRELRRAAAPRPRRVGVREAGVRNGRERLRRARAGPHARACLRTGGLMAGERRSPS
ncbi:MAG: hypothetical protein KatS3mg014_1093 [Actinomycetota bacterium]|nr:MAG: hypothetical protein KatS3mg014_1093 [Actinomycetota bacterium]